LLATVEPVTHQLEELEAEGCGITWPCFLEAALAEGMNEISRSTLKRLVAMPGDLRLDVYGVFSSDEDF
jgi:hypothetical protein